MTNRERLLKVFRGEEVDRVPVSPFIHENYVREFFKDNSVDVNAGTVEIYDYFGFDIIHRNCTIWEHVSDYGVSGGNWVVENTIEDKTNEKLVTTTITTPERQMRQVLKVNKVYEYESVQAKMECFIKEEEDFAQFIKYQPPVREYDCSPIKAAKELIGEKGILAPWVNGAFNSLTEMRKLDDAIMDAYTDPRLYQDMMEYFGSRALEAMKQFKKAGADVLSYTGNIGNATLVGPRFFKDFILAYEKSLIHKIQDDNLHILYHNCGDANSLLEIYNEVGFSAYESLTPPPYGDTDFDYALRTLDGRITLHGNIDQIDLLRKGSAADIQAAVKSLLEKAKARGNFILGTTDYINENTSADGMKAFAEAGFKYGTY